MSEHEKFMRRAMNCAKKAAALGEVPVGAVIVRDGKVIASGYNKRESGKNALLHAEMVAIHRACRKLGGWRLSDCDLYVTLEPCPMCTGAIINSRIRRVYIGAMDPKAGCMGSVCDLTAMPFNHQPEIVSGVLEVACAEQLSAFFRNLRNSKKPEPKSVSLRSFTQNDAAALKNYLYPRSSLKQTASMIEGWSSRLYEGRYAEYFAVMAEKDLVGSVQLAEQPDGTVCVDVHVFPGFRGKGYGTRAVLKMFDLAVHKGYRTVTAHVRKSNVPALRLCAGVGLVRVGESVTARGIPVWCMSRSLD